MNQEVFEFYVDAVMALPAKRGRVATWPVATLLLYIAQPERFMFLKPEVTKTAAETLGFDLHYASSLNWGVDLTALGRPARFRARAPRDALIGAPERLAAHEEAEGFEAEGELA